MSRRNRFTDEHRRALVLRRDRPRSADELDGWLRLALGVALAREPRGERGRGFAAPFDYVAHAFFGEAEPRDCVVWACRGGGKTFLAAVATALDLVFKPGVEVRVLGGSLEQSSRLHGHLRRLFARPGLRELLAEPVSARRVALKCGSVCEVMAQSETSVRGCRPQILRCDEVELFKPEVWEAAQLVTRSRRCGGVYVRAAVEALSTMHEPHGLMAGLVGGGGRRVFRWSVIDVLERCPEERACAGCPLWGDCGGRAKRSIGHVSIDDAIVMQSRVSSAAWEAEMLCAGARRESAVFPEFRRETHVGAFGPGAGEAGAVGGVRWVCGMDFGFRAPTVILWAFVDGEGALRVVDERSASEMALEAHVRALQESEWPRPEWIGVDPAARQRDYHSGVSTAHALRRAGFAVRDRARGVHEGVMAVRARLAPAAGGSARLFVHERCEKLIESMERLRYPEGDERSLEPVKDGADHACDALRYLVVSLDCGRGARVGSYLG